MFSKKWLEGRLLIWRNVNIRKHILKWRRTHWILKWAVVEQLSVIQMLRKQTNNTFPRRLKVEFFLEHNFRGPWKVVTKFHVAFLIFMIKKTGIYENGNKKTGIYDTVSLLPATVCLFVCWFCSIFFTDLIFVVFHSSWGVINVRLEDHN